MDKNLIGFTKCAFFFLVLSGIALASSTALAVSITSIPRSTFVLASTPGDSQCDGALWRYSGAKMILLSSSEATFEVGGQGIRSFFYDPVGLTEEWGAGSLDGKYTQLPSGVPDPSKFAPRVLWKLPSRSCWNWVYAFPGGKSAEISIIGNEAFLTFEKPPYSQSDPKVTGRMVFNENAGPYMGVSRQYVMTAVPFNAEEEAAAYHFIGIKNQPYYFQSKGLGYSSSPISIWFYVDSPFISERGSKFTMALGSRSASVLLQKNVAKAKFTFLGISSRSAPHSFSTYISDSVDRTPGNRQFDSAQDSYPADISLDDTAQILSPLRGALKVVGTDAAAKLYRIGSEQYKGFFPYSITVPGETKLTYKGYESFWVGTQENGVEYQGAFGINGLVANYDTFAYSLRFASENNNFGIPVCIVDQNGDGNWANCEKGYQTSNRKVTIRYLNDLWEIVDMQPPIASLPSSSGAVAGGLVALKSKSTGKVEILVDWVERQGWDGTAAQGEPYVSLIWKNRGYGISSLDASPDSLREIVVYENLAPINVRQGEITNFPLQNPAFKITFSGISYSDAPIPGGKPGVKPVPSAGMDYVSLKPGVPVPTNVKKAENQNGKTVDGKKGILKPALPSAKPNPVPIRVVKQGEMYKKIVPALAE